MKWSEEKILKQKNYFKEQRINLTGHFAEFLVRTFCYIYKHCKESDDGLVISNISNRKEFVLTIGSGIKKYSKGEEVYV